MNALENKNPRKRLLLSAYSICPDRGSEPGVGWHRALQAAGEFDTWVLCRSLRQERQIKDWLEIHGEIPGLNFIFIPLTRIEVFLDDIPKIGYLVYKTWQRRAYSKAVELHRELQFDLVHHVTYCGYREPGYLWRLDIPFIWGPVGGTQDYPWRFLPKARLSGILTEGLRTIINKMQLRFSRHVRQGARRAALLLAANSQVAADLKKSLGVDATVLPDVGIDVIGQAVRERRKEEHPFRILWSGRLEHWKALHLLLHALSELKGSLDFQLNILGSGSLQHPLKKMADRLGIEDDCIWLGNVPFETAMAEYEWADVFIFTSLRDTFGTVILEAMGHGLPVISLNRGGAADAITPECGITIPVTKPNEVIHGLASAIRHLAVDPDRLDQLRRGALKRAEEFLWENNSSRLIEMLNSIIDTSTATAADQSENRPET